MKTKVCILLVTLVLVAGIAKAQLIDVKPWRGTYPDMKGSYPMSFVSFKGWLFPKPHFFVRAWPTHYYIKLDALPVSDTEDYAAMVRINLVKIVARLIEKGQMEDRYNQISSILDNMQGQKDIEQQLFDARWDELPDIYGIAEAMLRLYQSIDRMEKLEDCTWLKNMLETEADQLLIRFITVNLLQTDHGEKLDAFAGIKKELNQQIGEADYTYRKVHYFQYYAKEAGRSYSFLTE